MGFGQQAWHVLHLSARLPDLSEVLEVRPGTVCQDELAAVERLLETAPREVGQTARLVHPAGAAIELPRDIHPLLVSIVNNLKAGHGVSVIPSMPSSRPRKPPSCST